MIVLFFMSRVQPRCIWPNQSLLLWMGQLTKYGWLIIAHSTDLLGIVWLVVLSWQLCAIWGWWRRTARWDFLTGGEVKCLNFYLKDLSFPISFSLYRFGVPLIDGGTVRLPKLIGLSRAMDLILTGRMLDPKVWRIVDHMVDFIFHVICEYNFYKKLHNCLQEALEWGLANRVCSTGTAYGQAVNLAKEIVKFPQVQ